jgi:type II secretory pathway pseudopilin PulG
LIEMKDKPATYRHGFSLLELTIILTVLALLIAGNLATKPMEIKQSQQEETRAEMAHIAKALIAFTKEQGRLPCPMQMTAVRGTDRFGDEATTAANCGIGDSIPIVPVDDTGTWWRQPITGVAGHQAKIGGVPIYALGLSDEYVGDAWGNRYVYVVPENLIDSADPRTTAGSIKLYASDLTTITQSDASFVLVSHGIGGRGSYITESGATNVQLCGVATYILDGENCDHSNDAMYINITQNLSDNAATFYNDLVLTKTMADFQ